MLVKIYKDRKAAQAFADKQENAEVASDTFYFDKIQKKKSVDEVSAEYVNKDAYNYKVGDIIGNTIDGFDFKVIRIEGDKVTVKDIRSGKEFRTYKDNMYKGGVGLQENKLLKEEMSLEIDDDFIELTADSGTYDAYIEDDGTVDFSVTYEDEDDRDGEEFDEDNWKDILGPNHAFVKISNQIPTKVEAVDDYVMITVDVEDLKGIANLSENKLIKENSEYFHRGANGTQIIIIPDDLGEVDSDEFYDQLEGLSDGRMSEMDFEVNKEYEVYMGGDDIIFKLVKQGNDLIIDKDSIKIE